MKNVIAPSPDEIGLFQELLMETCGHYFDESRKQTLIQALWDRLQHRGYDSYHEYYNLLKYHPEGRFEIRELLDQITIGETYFFRNKAQFDVLMKYVLPEIIQKKGSLWNKDIRIWSAGCSRGDETYSIAIALMETLPSYKEWNISILGTDINRNGLTCAKEGIYGEKDINHLPKEYLEKYFEVRGPSYLLKAEVKELVQFEYHNLATDPFIHEKMQNLDILFCRNVTIYFDEKTTRRVIENFYNCLSQDGYLFLGHAETLWQITNNFESVEYPQSIIYKKRVPPIQNGDRKPFMAIPEINLKNLFFPDSATNLNHPIQAPLPSHQDQKRYDSSEEFNPKIKEEPIKEVSSEGDNPPSHLKAFIEGGNTLSTFLAQATLLANEARYKEATDILIKIIDMDNLSIEAHYLLGVLFYKSNQLKEAEKQFRKVIYISPESVLAYFNLGNIYLYQKRYTEARREFRNAIRLLEKRPKDESVRFCEDFTVEFLLRACKNHLAMIAKRGE